jgi:hypothetical protein
MVAQKSIKKENACMRDFASATLTQNIITLYIANEIFLLHDYISEIFQM